MHGLRRSGPLLVSLQVVLLGAASEAWAEERRGRLILVDSVERPDFNGINDLVIPSDGRFLYAASWKSGTVNVFTRDRKSGGLAHRQTLPAVGVLQGSTSLALSPDGRFAVLACFSGRQVQLFRRNADNGELTLVDGVGDGERGVRLLMPIRAAVSLDSKFAYILDDQRGAVVALRVNDEKLELVGSDEGNAGCYKGARGLAFHPDNRRLFVVCSRAGTLVAADRDEQSGVTSVRQVVRAGNAGRRGLAGAFGVAVSPDGRFVLISSGRMNGANAVSVFRLAADGRLEFVQQFVNDGVELPDFKGGGKLIISPDGRNVYAVATLSGTIASFGRDPESGKLTFLETVPDGGQGGPFGAAGIAISPDGEFVYVAAEDKRLLSIFKRSLGH